MSAIAAVACEDIVSSAPRSRPLPSGITRYDVTPLPPAEKGLSPTPGTRVFIATYPFPEQIVVEGKITGTVEITSDPLARWQVVGFKDYRGYSQSSTLGTQCAVSASFTWGNSASPGMPCSGSNPASVWVDTIRVMDSVWAQRGPPIQESSGQCGVGVPCHTYPTATTVLTLMPLAASLKYSANLPFLWESQMLATYPPAVTFLASANPPSLGAFTTPKRFLERAWHKADPSVGPPNTDINGYCGPWVLVCQLYVREAGIFWGKERVNGVEQTDSVAINCYTGDSLVDFLEARRAYLDAMDSSNAADPNQNNRKEHVVAITQDSAGLHAIPISIHPDSATQCTSNFRTPAPSDSFGKIRAYVHTHPYKVNEQVQCAGSNRLDRARPGLSDSDYKYMTRHNQFIQNNYSSSGWQPVPWYAMDKINVYRLKPGQKLKESTKPANTFKWQSGRCKWAKPTKSQLPGYFYVTN